MALHFLNHDANDAESTHTQKKENYVRIAVLKSDILHVWRENTMIYQTNKIGNFVFAGTPFSRPQVTQSIDEMKRMSKSFSFYYLQFLNKHNASLHF